MHVNANATLVQNNFLYLFVIWKTPHWFKMWTLSPYFPSSKVPFQSQGHHSVQKAFCLRWSALRWARQQPEGAIDSERGKPEAGSIFKLPPRKPEVLSPTKCKGQPLCLQNACAVPSTPIKPYPNISCNFPVIQDTSFGAEAVASSAKSGGGFSATWGIGLGMFKAKQPNM